MTRQGIQLSLLILISLLLLSCKTGIRKEQRVLVYTKNGEGYVHDNIENNVKAIKELGNANGFFVDVSDSPDLFTEENLAKYSCIVFLDWIILFVVQNGRPFFDRDDE